MSEVCHKVGIIFLKRFIIRESTLILLVLMLVYQFFLVRRQMGALKLATVLLDSFLFSQLDLLNIIVSLLLFITLLKEYLLKLKLVIVFVCRFRTICISLTFLQN